MRSFRSRLVALVIVLVITIQAVTLFAVLAHISNTESARAAGQLQAGGALVRNIESFRTAQLQSSIAVLASDFGFRQAVAAADRATMTAAAENHARRVHADLLFVLDPQGAVLAATHASADRSLGRLAEQVAQADAASGSVTFVAIDARAYQFFLAPVRAPDVVAWIAMGFRVDDAFARELAKLAQADVSIVARGDGLKILASSLPVGARTALSTARLDALSDGAAAQPLSLAHEDYLTALYRLDGHGAVDVLLHKSMAEVMAPYRDARNTVLLFGGAMLGVAAILSLLLGRSVARPIDRLVLAARRIRKGEYHEPVPMSGGQEFAHLASTFNAMQQAIAERETRLTHQLYHDALTGLGNRLLAETRLKEIVSGGPAAGSVGLVLIDMKNLRDVNASLGHQVGDETVREAARRLVALSRPSDIVTRFAANQFLLVTRDTNLARCMDIARRCAKELRIALCAARTCVDVEVAAGVWVGTEQDVEVEELLRRVEFALYEAIAKGELAVGYRAETDLGNKRRWRILHDLKAAIGSNELTLAYQPKVTLARRQVTGFEALARWQHPELGAISPMEFVPVAEQAGFCQDLTRWVVSEALRQVADWHKAGLKLEIAVNLSASDIIDTQLVHWMLQEIERSRLPAGTLTIELTESAVLRDPQAAARNMQALKAAGVSFSIDDFGTGYSSLTQLQRLPVDELKIDKSFVSESHLREDDATIVRSTIELAHSMGLRVVAEGVENSNLWRSLGALGCDYAQGYFISKPMAPSEVANWVRSVNADLEDAASQTAQVRVLESARS
jgi:diguanylate cyclase (GGDEF)-like protein